LPATPVSASTRIATSRWPGLSSGGAISIPFCSSESAGRSEPATSPTSWARLRSAVFGAQRFGMVTSVTASSGTDSNAFSGLSSDSSVILGSTSVRTSAT
jgi:hypothetical protein